MFSDSVGLGQASRSGLLTSFVVYSFWWRWYPAFLTTLWTSLSSPKLFIYQTGGNRPCKVNGIIPAYSSSEPLTKSSKSLASQILQSEPFCRVPQSPLWIWVIWYKPKVPDESIPVHTDAQTGFCGETIFFLSQQLKVQTSNNFLFLSSFCHLLSTHPLFSLPFSLLPSSLHSLCFLMPFTDWVYALVKK